MSMNEKKLYGWREQLAVGASGERVVRDWLRSRGYTVVDVTGERDYQAKDIDLLLLDPECDPQGDAYPPQDCFWIDAEVKTDTYPNQFVFFETHTAENNPGALFKSRAQVWYIYKSALGKVIEVDPARVVTHLYVTGRKYTERLYPVFNERRQVRAWGVRLSLDDLTGVGGMVHLLEGDMSNEQTTGTGDVGTDRGGTP